MLSLVRLKTDSLVLPLFNGEEIRSCICFPSRAMARLERDNYAWYQDKGGEEIERGVFVGWQRETFFGYGRAGVLCLGRKRFPSMHCTEGSHALPANWGGAGFGQHGFQHLQSQRRCSWTGRDWDSYKKPPYARYFPASGGHHCLFNRRVPLHTTLRALPLLSRASSAKHLGRQSSA